MIIISSLLGTLLLGSGLSLGLEPSLFLLLTAEGDLLLET
jgi:hypothetical protein